MSILQWVSLAIVTLTFAGIAVGRAPALRMNRTTIAVVGAAALLLIGAITQKQALAAIDLGTIMLLFGMMIINVNLGLAGFFELVGSRVLRLTRSPRVLLALIIGVSGVLSALFLNDPVCLLFTPLVVEVTQRMHRDPVPYLIGLATAANVGSVATITGNPQNLIIGQASGIPYVTFLLHLAPVAVIGLGICWAVIVLLYRAEFRGELPMIKQAPPRTYPPLLWRSVAVVGLLLVAFLAGFPVATSAFIAAAALLVSRLKARRLLFIEWDLLLFFCGLFIVTGAIESVGLSGLLFTIFAPLLKNGVASLSILTAVLSNIVSNVPAVLLLRPEIPNLTNPQQAWLVLAMASTLAGNLTLLGSVANLIVAEIAARRGTPLSFGAYLRVGVPVTILTIIVGVIWLSLTG
jgi:Na+/H+ antiporter NhaD/arsenite permease-like protein